MPLAPASFVRSLQGGVLLVVAVVVAVGFLDPGNVIKLGIGLAFGLICLSLVPLTGWGGYVSICQLTFAGLGCSPWTSSAAGVPSSACSWRPSLAGGVGAVISLPALRLRGLYLALLTMAFACLMDNMFFPSSAVFSYNGSVAIHRPDLFGLDLSSARRSPSSWPSSSRWSRSACWPCAGGHSAVLVGHEGLRGRLRHPRAEPHPTKLVVFALSAAMAGFAGALYGAAKAVAGATSSTCSRALILAVVAIGGASVCSGALAG